jgi:subtilisin family serine protease
MASYCARTALALSACGLSLIVAGCGGGSGAKDSRPAPISAPPTAVAPPPAPPPPPPSSANFNTAEYQRSNGANAAGALSAYNAGGRGQGVKVAVVDSGINPALAEFAGRIDPASRDVAAGRGVTDTEGHGTAVSAVIAAGRNDSGMMGVAFEATILSLNTSNPKDCSTDGGCKHYDRDIGNAIDIARENGARVINISLGGEGAGGAVLSAISRATAAGIVVVISAGNESEANPSGFALQSAAQGNGLLIIAGAHDSARQMASFSNRAGDGAQVYLTALGRGVLAPDETGALYQWNGTSFSAPVISGAAALLASAFPNLTGAQIVELLLSSADDAGSAGQDSVYGRGILNIARAFEPKGQTTLAGSAIAVSTTSNGTTSGPMGDARPAMKGVVILDGYSRAYAVDLARTLARAPQERPLSSSFTGNVRTRSAGAGPVAVSLTVDRDLTGKASVGFAQMGLTYSDSREAKAVAGVAVTRLTPKTAAAFGFSESGRALQQRLSGREQNAFLVARDPMARNGFFAEGASSFGLRQDVAGLGITATSESGGVYRAGPQLDEERARYSISGVTLDRKVGEATISLGLSRLVETETVLGGQFGAAFGGSGSSTRFLDLSVAYPAGGGWDAGASYRRGWTRMNVAGALADSGALASDAFAFDLSRRSNWIAGDSLAFRIVQPLRVRSGGYGMNVPVTYDYKTGAVGYERQFFSLAPTGRELDFEAAYGLSALGGYLSANAFYRSQPGHIQAASGDVGAAIRFTLGM